MPSSNSENGKTPAEIEAQFAKISSQLEAEGFASLSLEAKQNFLDIVEQTGSFTHARTVASALLALQEGRTSDAALLLNSPSKELLAGSLELVSTLANALGALRNKEASSILESTIHMINKRQSTIE